MPFLIFKKDIAQGNIKSKFYNFIINRKSILKESKDSSNSQSKRQKKSFKQRRDSILRRLKFKPILKFNRNNGRIKEIFDNLNNKMDIYELPYHGKPLQRVEEENKVIKLNPTTLVDCKRDENFSFGRLKGEINKNSHINHDKKTLKFGEAIPQISKHKFDITKNYSNDVNKYIKLNEVSY